MWLFSSTQTLAESGILQGKTDYHSHILPGVDDGITTKEEAIEVLKQYENLGIVKVWLTPHIMDDYPNETEDLRKRFTELNKAYLEQGGKINLQLSAENMLSSLFVKRLETDDILPIIDEKHILVETSYYNAPYGFGNLLSRISDKGYTPILAHPERYYYMSMQEYEELHEKGIKFQLDYMSVLGAYGREVQERAVSLLKKRYYTIVGSDIHDLAAFDRWIREPIKKNVIRMLREIINN